MIPGKYRAGDRILIVLPFGLGHELLTVCPDCRDGTRRGRLGARSTSRSSNTYVESVCVTCDGWGALRVAS